MCENNDLALLNLLETVNFKLVKYHIVVKHWNIEYFFKLLDEELTDFLEHDRCFILADKYLIAMVFIYFLRASLSREEYTAFNFFIALHLAHDMEEDDDDARIEIVSWALYSLPRAGEDDPGVIMQHRDNLFESMNYRAAISPKCCEEIIRTIKPQHSIWERQRHVNHSGAIYSNTKITIECPNCSRDTFA